MANWCRTHFVVECNEKQKLQRICDAIEKCNGMPKPLIEDSSRSWTGNIFKELGLKYESERCFWNESYFEDDALQIFEESAWSRGSSMRQLVEQMNDPEDPDNDLVVYFRSEECGCEIYETNDTEGVYFPGRYMLDTSEDGEEYFSDFDDLSSAVAEVTGIYDCTTLGEVEKALDKYNRENEENNRWAFVHEFDTEVSL